VPAYQARGPEFQPPKKKIEIKILLIHELFQKFNKCQNRNNYVLHRLGWLDVLILNSPWPVLVINQLFISGYRKISLIKQQNHNP
jgi:hypothetical protein